MYAAEHVTAEGHRWEKCFSSTTWERLRDLFNKNVRKDWTITQLKNNWSTMRTEHKLLFQLLQCTGIACGLSIEPELKCHNGGGNRKLRYSRLFGGSCESIKYALTPTKLSQCGFDLGSDSETDDLNDMLPINAKTTDSSDGPIAGRASSSMNISFRQSDEKRKEKHAKGKRKKFSMREIFESVDTLAHASRVGLSDSHKRREANDSPRVHQ
ncbi:Hypothetical predicted protein [Olea europaea subsp. europaea]|uniref:Myb/SANT-like domain-containing protein n=1 Tax=Olea europaea subsp. europaea TaxID=158383 RepID=A0A8S0RPX4_OLEEU|nr:Hypothetical predicted protein [Olea europaea subsp. europaea]